MISRALTLKVHMLDGPKAWNPYYLAYAEAHGLTPQMMLERDDVKYPGGIMVGFVLWNHEQWRLYLKSIDIKPSDNEFSYYCLMHQEGYGKWLADKYGVLHA